MDLFTLDLTLNEIVFLRQALDLVTIKGNDAKFLANLQIKLENEYIEAQNLIKQEEEKKSKELSEIQLKDQVRSKK